MWTMINNERLTSSQILNNWQQNAHNSANLLDTDAALPKCELSIKESSLTLTQQQFSSFQGFKKSSHPALV